MRYQKNAFLKIFDTQVQPVILYSAEIWGLHRLSNVERVHTFACKRYLNVLFKVPNKFVYGETGRYPLYVNSAIRCNPILAENPQTGSCSSSKAKHTLCYSTWMKEERTAGLLVSETFCLALVSDTFGCNKAFGCDRAFISVFKQRLTDIYQQEWSASILQKDM